MDIKTIKDLPDNYTVIDIETTGLSNTKNEIIELSALKIRNNEIFDTFTTLVKPKGYISSFIKNLTGITNEMVSNAPNISEILDKYLNFIGKDTIVGHNVRFDIGFINHNSIKHYNKNFSNESIDTCKMAKRFTDLKRKNLETVANYFNIETTGHHRAERDCIMTFGIYNAMKNLKNTEINDVQCSA